MSNASPVNTTAAKLDIATMFFPAALLAVAVGDEAATLDVIFVQVDVAPLGTVTFADNVKSAH